VSPGAIVQIDDQPQHAAERSAPRHAP